MSTIKLPTRTVRLPLIAFALTAGLGVASAQESLYPADGLHPRPQVQQAAQRPVNANQYVGLYQGGQPAVATRDSAHPADGLHPYPAN